MWNDYNVYVFACASESDRFPFHSTKMEQDNFSCIVCNSTDLQARRTLTFYIRWWVFFWKGGGEQWNREVNSFRKYQQQQKPVRVSNLYGTFNAGIFLCTLHHNIRECYRPHAHLQTRDFFFRYFVTAEDWLNMDMHQKGYPDASDIFSHIPYNRACCVASKI